MKAGGDIHDAKVKLRHSTISMTSDTYMELFEEYEEALTERAAAAAPPGPEIGLRHLRSRTAHAGASWRRAGRGRNLP